MHLFLRAREVLKFALRAATDKFRKYRWQVKLLVDYGDLNLSGHKPHHEKKLKPTTLQNPSMRAVAKILRARESEQSRIFASTFKLNGTIQ